MNEQLANAVYDILVAEAGAREDERHDFVYHVTHGCGDYRCCPELGFGGKFWPERMDVTYYPEDQTTERDNIAAKVNWKLRELAERIKNEA